MRWPRVYCSHPGALDWATASYCMVVSCLRSLWQLACFLFRSLPCSHADRQPRMPAVECLIDWSMLVISIALLMHRRVARITACDCSFAPRWRHAVTYHLFTKRRSQSRFMHYSWHWLGSADVAGKTRSPASAGIANRPLVFKYWAISLRVCVCYFQRAYCLTLYGHIKTAAQRTIIQQYGDWYTGRWGWSVTSGTARRGLSWAVARPVPSSLYQM